MYDALHVLSNALQELDKSTRLRLVNLTCEGDQAWAFGSSLYNYLNLVSIFAGVMLHPNYGVPYRCYFIFIKHGLIFVIFHLNNHSTNNMKYNMK